MTAIQNTKIVLYSDLRNYRNHKNGAQVPSAKKLGDDWVQPGDLGARGGGGSRALHPLHLLVPQSHHLRQSQQRHRSHPLHPRNV